VQVATGDVYAAESERQQLKPVRLVAARGEIIDANGVVIATVVRQPRIIVDPSFIGEEDLEQLTQEIAGLLDGSAASDIRELFDNARPNTVFPLKGLELTAEDAYFILEHRGRFPGIDIEWTPVRSYPLGDIASHLLGYAAAPSEADLERNPELPTNGTVGKAGVERYYDELLQGNRGTTFFRIDPSGKVISLESKEASTPGATVQLNLDIDLQWIIQAALADGIANSRLTEVDEDTGDASTASRGAVVVLDANSGAVVGMASFPDYTPQGFVDGFATEDYAALLDSQAFNNLAIQGQYPPGSTFKAITYYSAWEEEMFAISAEEQSPSGVIHINAESRLDLPSLEDASQKQFFGHCPSVDADIHEAFIRSCNVYFWEIAANFWEEFKGTDSESAMQDHARNVGLGARTGIDLPFEKSGVIPDRELFTEWAETGDARLSSARLEAGALWNGGDLLNLSIGQGSAIATPLQMATAYAALSTGKLYEPHVVRRVMDHNGVVLEQYNPTLIRELDLAPGFLTAFRNDMALVTQAQRGTADGAFAGMDQLNRTGGKTGTADGASGKLPHAWFVGVTPIQAPEYVIAVVVEEGGSGGLIAAPIARAIMQYLLGEQVDPIIEDGLLSTLPPWLLDAALEEVEAVAAGG
jgi:penicillin-binding protein 2